MPTKTAPARRCGAEQNQEHVTNAGRRPETGSHNIVPPRMSDAISRTEKLLQLRPA